MFKKGRQALSLEMSRDELSFLSSWRCSPKQLQDIKQLALESVGLVKCAGGLYPQGPVRAHFATMAGSWWMSAWQE